MKELPAWPEIRQFPGNRSGYQYARAEAAIARLKLAMEALDEIETEARQADDDNECADEVHKLAMDARALIGDIPE